MRIGDQLRALEAAGADDVAFIRRPNVMRGERVAGRIVLQGRAAVFIGPDGRAVRLAANDPPDPGPAVATVVEQIGAQPRAYDVEPTTPARGRQAVPASGR